MDKLPAYQNVYRTIKQQIKDGTYLVDALLPPEPELEKIHKVSRTTIRHAISMLESDGYLEVCQGRGTKVLSAMDMGGFRKFHNITSVSELLMEPNKEFSIKDMCIDRVFATEDTAKALEISPNTQVFRIQRILCIDHHPFALMTNFLRMDIVPDLDQYNHNFVNLYQFLEEQYNVFFKSGVEQISATVSDFLESQVLQVEAGTPLLYCKRTARCSLGPMEYVITKLRTDKFSLSVYMEGRR